MALRALSLALAASAVSAAFQWGKGWNLGNTLEAPVEGEWAPAAQEYFFDDVKAKGFTAVRIPVRWDNHTGTSSPYAVDPAFMARVIQVTNWSLSRGFTTLINSHHDDWLDDPVAFPSQLPRFLAIWTQISAAFSGFPDNLVFEVYNEPHVMTAQQLNTMNAAVLSILRSSPGLHPTRSVLVGGLQWMSPHWILANPTALALPALADGSADPNLALEFHDYDPFTWTSPPINTNETWGSVSDIQAVYSLMQNMSSWAKSVRPAGTPPLPLLMGEFATSIQQTNTTARLLWYSTMSSAAEEYGINWSIWDDDGWYRTYDRAARSWDVGVLTALGLSTR